LNASDLKIAQDWPHGVISKIKIKWKWRLVFVLCLFDYLAIVLNNEKNLTNQQNKEHWVE
jgi:hypothetical protein